MIGSALDDFFGDRMDTAEYVERLECAFDVRIPGDDAAAMKTLDDLCAWLGKRTTYDADHIWMQVRRITAEEFGVCETELLPTTRFVEDLGC
jgi:hypothetical protein